MEAQKKSARRACAAILAAAALWGVIGIWNRRLMAAGLLPTSIVTEQEGMVDFPIDMLIVPETLL